MKRRTAKALKRAVAGMHFKTCGRSVTGVCTGGLPHAHRLKLSCAYGSFSLAGTRAFQVHILVQAHSNMRAARECRAISVYIMLT